MDANQAIQAARDCVTRAIANEGVHQLNFQKAVWECGKKEWHITFCISRTQDKQDTKCAKSVCTIDDSDGRITSTIITDCPFCDRKCANQASGQDTCSAEQNEQSSSVTSTSARWSDALQSWYRAFVVYPRTAVGDVALIMICVAVVFKDITIVEEILKLLAVVVGIIIGIFVAGAWWQKRGYQRPDSNKRNRNGR